MAGDHTDDRLCFKHHCMQDMSRHHGHGDCNGESHHHDHHHDLPEGVGPRDNLFTRIDRDNVIALNAQDPGKGPEVIKPWDQRLDEDKVRRSSHLPLRPQRRRSHSSTSSRTRMINCELRRALC